MKNYNENEILSELQKLHGCLENICLLHNFEIKNKKETQSNFGFVFHGLAKLIVHLRQKQKVLSNIEKCQLYIVEKIYYELKLFIEYN